MIQIAPKTAEVEQAQNKVIENMYGTGLQQGAPLINWTIEEEDIVATGHYLDMIRYFCAGIIVKGWTR